MRSTSIDNCGKACEGSQPICLSSEVVGEVGQSEADKATMSESREPKTRQVKHTGRKISTMGDSSELVASLVIERWIHVSHVPCERLHDDIAQLKKSLR